MTIGLAAILGGGATFLPPSLTGLVLWLRADRGVTSTGGTFTWRDQSGTGDPNKNVSTSSTLPVLNTSNAAYANQATITFSSGTDQLTSGTWATALTQPFTEFIVGHATTSVVNTLVLNTIGSVFEQSSATFVPGMSAGGGLVTSTGNWSSPSVFGAVFNGSSSKIFFNSHLQTGGAGAPGATGRTNYQVGRTHGPIAEVATYNRILSATEITQVMKYLGTRYGITIA